MTRVRQYYRGGASKVRISNNYPNRKIVLKSSRISKIRIRKS